MKKKFTINDLKDVEKFSINKLTEYEKNNLKFIKVMFGNQSKAGVGFEYKIDEVNETDNWHPETMDGKEIGGFSFSVEEKLIRWIIRGDTLYDVIIPKDGEVYDLESPSAPHGVFRSNKIIITNPIPITDKLAMELYKKSNLPEKSYYKALIGCAIRGYRNTCLEIIREKINSSNIDAMISEVEDFVSSQTTSDIVQSANETYNEVIEILKEIKSNLDISICVSKEPYEKILTKDNIINVTGQSGSGKTTYTRKFLNDDNYIVIDTDEIGVDKYTNNKNCIEFRNYLKEKYGENIPELSTNFDNIYNEILDYYKGTNKTIVIDCAEFHSVKDINILKGKIIIIRTCIDECYRRCIERYKKENPKCSKEEFEKYKKRKLSIYKWYKGTNEFIEKIDMIENLC